MKFKCFQGHPVSVNPEHSLSDIQYVHKADLRTQKVLPVCIVIVSRVLAAVKLTTACSCVFGSPFLRGPPMSSCAGGGTELGGGLKLVL